MASAAVVGGGFAGLSLALALARSGLKVYLIEEHAEVGYPPHCTGVVSSKVVEMLGRPASSSIAYELREIKVAFNGSIIAYIRPKNPFYRLDRVLLEKLMLEEAEKEGVEVLLGTRAESISEGGKVSGGGFRGYFDLVVIADGWTRKLSGRLGLGGYRRRLTGVNVIADRLPEGPRPGEVVVEAWSPFSRGFFSWVIGGPDHYLAGTASAKPQDPALYVKSLRSLGVEVKAIYGGQVVLGPPEGPLRRGRVVVAGDAAGLTKPLTGGGLYPMSKAARLAEDILSAGKVAEPYLAVEKALRTVGLELKSHLAAARAIQKSDRIFRAASEVLGGASVTFKIDFDDHSLASIARGLLGNAPSLTRTIIKSPLKTLKLIAHIIIDALF